MKKLIFILLSFNAHAQLDADWDATDLLSNINESWSIGNGCSENGFKVVTVYGDIEIEDNTIEVMDIVLQLINGNITQYGNIIDYYNHPNILFSCDSSDIICYNETLGDNEENSNRVKLIVYPNPTSDYLNIKSETLVVYEIRDINGKIVKSGKNSIINVTNLENSLYFLITLHLDGYKHVSKFIKK